MFNVSSCGVSRGWRLTTGKSTVIIETQLKPTVKTYDNLNVDVDGEICTCPGVKARSLNFGEEASLVGEG